MKRLLFNLIICCACFIAASCSREAAVGGIAEKAKSLGLYTFDKGRITLLQEIDVDKATGTFEVTLDLPYNGLYLFGKNKNLLFPVYLKGGERVNLELRNNLLNITGDNISKENRALFDWENCVHEMKVGSYLHKYLPGGHALDHEQMFGQLQRVAASKEKFLAALEVKKSKFSAFLINKIKADFDFYLMNYLRTEKFNIPDSSALDEYYGTFVPDAVFQDTEILDVPHVGKMLESYVWYLNRDNEQEKGEVKYFTESLKEKSLQQEYLLSAASGMKFYDEYQNLFAQVGEEFFDAEYMSEMAKEEQRLLWSKPGSAAFDFEAMAPDSSMVKLSDYKGKTVVVDVWATWCEPCRRMMPMFHELQKQLQNENVVFLSVCVGTWIEYDQWLEMNKLFHLTENTLFVSGWNSDFVKNYHITGVPRYMIFDKEGAIVTLSAPNPTTPKLKERILQVL